MEEHHVFFHKCRRWKTKHNLPQMLNVEEKYISTKIKCANVISILPQIWKVEDYTQSSTNVKRVRKICFNKNVMWKNIMYSSTNVEGERLNITFDKH